MATLKKKATLQPELDPVSAGHLEGVHADLADVITEAARRCRFRLTEGVRTRERQRVLVAQRKSKTLNSRHITGHAVDYIAINAQGIATYNAADMTRVANVIKAVAAEKGIPVVWGGDWKSDPSDDIGWDSPHIELDRNAYPANAVGLGTRVLEVARDNPKTTGMAAIGAVEGVQQMPTVPDVPAAVTDGIASLGDWMAAGDAISAAAAWVGANPKTAAVCLLWGAGAMFGPWAWKHIKGAWTWVGSWRFSPAG